MHPHRMVKIDGRDLPIRELVVEVTERRSKRGGKTPATEDMVDIAEYVLTATQLGDRAFGDLVDAGFTHGAVEELIDAVKKSRREGRPPRPKHMANRSAGQDVRYVQRSGQSGRGKGGLSSFLRRLLPL